MVTSHQGIILRIAMATDYGSYQSSSHPNSHHGHHSHLAILMAHGITSHGFLHHKSAQLRHATAQGGPGSDCCNGEAVTRGEAWHENWKRNAGSAVLVD